MGGLVKAVFDPAGIFGNWEDTPGGPAPQPRPLAQPGSLAHMAATAGMAGINPEEPGVSTKDRYQGFLGGMMPNAGGAAAQAYSPDAKVKPADFSAQWQFSPGKGPQWTEPERVSSDNSVPWQAKVNNGPAKGNRF